MWACKNYDGDVQSDVLAQGKVAAGTALIRFAMDSALTPGCYFYFVFLLEQGHFLLVFLFLLNKHAYIPIQNSLWKSSYNVMLQGQSYLSHFLLLSMTQAPGNHSMLLCTYSKPTTVFTFSLLCL